MKKLIKIILLMLIFIGFETTYAQQNDHSVQQKDTLPVAHDSAMKNYVSMQAAQMIFIQNDKVGRMTKDMTMKNGTIVTTRGLVKTKDGHSFQLKEGDRVYMNGLIEGLAKTQKD